MTAMHKSEIENLAAGFRAKLISVSLKYWGSDAVGAVGGFVADIEAHRAGCAKKFAMIRVGADPATITLANETERTIDALAQEEIQRVRNAGRVELNPELPPDQQPPQSHATVDPITNKKNRKKRMPARRGAHNLAPVGLEIMANESGPEKYAPPDRHAQRRDIEHIMFLQWSQAGLANDPAAENLNAAVKRVASMSLDEIDQVIISALEGVRNMMPKEGECVSRENRPLRQSEPRGSNGDEGHR